MMDFNIAKFQASIFTPELTFSNSMRFLEAVSELLSDRVGQNPSVLPIPQDAPAEIPRIQFISRDRKWRLNISLSRTDLIYRNSKVSDETRIRTDEFSLTSRSFFPAYMERLDLGVQRLAFITERFSLAEDATGYVVKRFCRKEDYDEKGRPFHNANKFEVHSYKRYDWEDFHLNSWVRVKSIDFKPDDIDSSIPVIYVENDLNTLSSPEDRDRRFSVDEIVRFFASAPDELKEILKTYFVEEGDPNGETKFSVH
jgi:hypothetical protein